MNTRSSWDNFLVLEFRRTQKLFNKLNQRYLKRQQNKSFDQLSRKKQYYLIRKLRKLKSKLDQLMIRMKMGVAAGSIAASVLLAFDADAQNLTANNAVQINPSTPGTQVASDISPNGDMVVVWRSEDGNGNIMGRIYNSDYQPQTSELTLADPNEGNSESFEFPDVAIDQNGDFILVFGKSSYFFDSGPQYNNSIEVRKFDETGTLVPSFNETISTYTGNTIESNYPKIAMDDDGDFLLVWQTLGINNDGTFSVATRGFDNGAWGTQSQLFDQATNEAKRPDVAVSDNGDFLVAWTEYEGNWSGTDFYGVKYKRNNNGSFGTTLEAWDASNPNNSSKSAEIPSIALDNNGSFVVSFFNRYGSPDGITTLSIDQNDQLITSQFNPASNLDFLDVAVDKNGNRNIVYTNGSDFDFIRTDQFGNSIQSYGTFSNGGINGVQVEISGDDVIAIWHGYYGDNDVYYKRFSNNQDPSTIGVSGHIVINDATVNGSPQDLSISNPGEDGSFVVVWRGNDMSSINQIYAQRFNEEGGKIGGNILVTDATNGEFDKIPKVAMDGDGNFVVAWQQSSDIVIRLFDANGDDTSGEIIVADAGSDINANQLDVAFDDDNGIISFSDIGTFNIHFVKFDAAGTFSAEVPISNGSFEGNSAVALDENGDALIAWEQYYGGNTFMYGVTVASGSTTATSPFQISTIANSGSGNQVISQADNEFIIIWHDGNQNLQFTEYKDGSVGNTKTVDYNNTSADVNSVSYSEDELFIASGYSLVSLDIEKDIRGEYSSFDYSTTGMFGIRTGGNRFFAGITSNEARLSTLVFTPSNNFERPVNLTATNNQINPVVAREKDGSYIVVWEESIESDGAISALIKGQKFNNENERVGPEFTIVDADMTAGQRDYHRHPAITLREDGTFVVAWENTLRTGSGPYNYTQDVLAKRFDANCNPIDADPFIVYAIPDNEVVNTRNEVHPDIASDPNGNFIIAWSENTYGLSRGVDRSAIRSQKFNASAAKDGPVDEWFSEDYNVGYFDHRSVSVDMDESGDFVLAYETFRYTEGYSGYINVISSKDWSYQATVDVNYMSQDLKILEDGKIVLAFTDRPESTDIEGVIFDASGSKIVDNFEMVYDGDRPTLHADAGEGFAVGFYDSGVKVQRFGIDGKTIGAEVTVNNTSITGNPDIAIDEAGDIIVVWSQYGVDGDYSGILSKELLTPFPIVDISAINVTEGETKDLTNSLDVSDNFGSSDWDFQVLEATSNGSTSVGSQTLSEGSTFKGSDVEANNVTYIHDGTETQSDKFEFEVKNGFGYSRTVTGDITITNINDVPVLKTALVDQATDEDASFSYEIAAGSFTDEETSTLTYSAELESGGSLPEWLTFTGTTFSGTPANADVGTINVKVIASDGTNSASDVFELKVENVNDAPIATAIDDQTAKEGDPFSLTVKEKFSDVDADDVLTLSATQEDGTALPAWLTFNATDGSFSGTPTTESVGTLFVKVMATDKAGLTASDVFAIEISADTKTNEPPALVGSINDQVAVVGEPFSLKIDPSSVFSDPDSPTLTITVTQSNDTELPTWLSFDNEENTLAGIPGEGDEGEFLVKVNASDEENTTSAVFKMTVEGEEKLGLEDQIISVFPNPTAEYLQLDWGDKVPKVIRVYNFKGQLSLETEIQSGDKLDVSSLPVGNYVLAIGTDKITTFKFIKSRNN